MNFLRNHWYDIGGILAITILAFVFLQSDNLTYYQLIMWFSFVSLLLHQLEEYRVVGTFPGMVNRVMFSSEFPDRYPLNTKTAFIVNVVLGWTLYFLAAFFAEKVVWLGMAAILVSLGNIMAHTFIFNIKGRSIYNPGLVTCWLFFAPCVYFFFFIVHTERLATATDYLIGIPLGIVVNYIGILKLIEWMADKDSPYSFKDRNLLPEDRGQESMQDY